MKKGILMVFFGLLIIGHLFSQDLTTGSWQWQNPNIASLSSILTFEKNGKLVINTTELATGQKETSEGIWQLIGITLIIKMATNKVFHFTVNWLNINRFNLEAGDGILIYSQANTPEDQFLISYLNYQKTLRQK